MSFLCRYTTIKGVVLLQKHCIYVVIPNFKVNFLSLFNHLSYHLSYHLNFFCMFLTITINNLV